MNIKSIGQFAKAITGSSGNNIPFASRGGGGYGGYGGGYGYGAYGNGLVSIPGADYDWRNEAGTLWENGVVAACIEAISQAFIDAPPILQEKVNGDWELVPDSDEIGLLLHPNDEYSAANLWGLTVLSDCSEGMAYWRLDWGKSSGRPERIWYQEHSTEGASRVYPLWSDKEFISGYKIWVEGKEFTVKKEQLIYMRHMLNPRNTRLGWSPLNTVMRQIAGDNRVATFHSAILKNGVIPGQVWSPTGGGANQQAESVARNVTPDQARAFKAALVRQYSGEGAGEPLVTDMPFEPHNSTYTPDQLALDKLGQYYALRICAALKVPAMIIGISETNKTYSNMEVAIKDFWQRTIQPMQKRLAAELATQYLPHFGLDTSKYRLGWDYSDVEALQESESAEWERITKAVGGPWLSVEEGRKKAGYEGDLPKPEGVEPEPESDETAARFDAAVVPDEVEAKTWDESKHPRDDDGKFASGGSGSHNNGMTADKVRELETKYNQAKSKEQEYWRAHSKEIRKEQKDFDTGKRSDRPIFQAYLDLGLEVTARGNEFRVAQEQFEAEANPKEAAAPREVIKYSDKRTSGTVLVARYSDDIDADIKRGWSAYQHSNYGGTRAEVERDAKEMGIKNPVIRKVPQGGYALVHHDGLSSYELNSEAVDDAEKEAGGNQASSDGSGYGHATIGRIRKMRTIPKELIGSIRDLHILEVESVEVEQMTPMLNK